MFVTLMMSSAFLTTSCTSFLNILSSQHDNIKFSIEKSIDTLQFFDLKIKITENITADTVHRFGESSLIRVFFLEFASTCPLKRKSGLVFCMLRRAKLICSSDS